MLKIRKQSFSELVKSNKQEIMKDHDALNRIEKKIETKHLNETTNFKHAN